MRNPIFLQAIGFPANLTLNYLFGTGTYVERIDFKKFIQAQLLTQFARAYWWVT